MKFEVETWDFKISSNIQDLSSLVSPLEDKYDLEIYYVFNDIASVIANFLLVTQ